MTPAASPAADPASPIRRFAGKPPRDPLAPTRPGAWDDGHIRVRRRQQLPPGQQFRVRRDGPRVLLEHNLGRDQLDNALASLLALQVCGPAGLTDPADLGRLVTGCVRSTVPGGLASWAVFYDNSLAGLARARSGDDPIAAFSRIYAHARALVRGRSVLDLGSCLGMLPMQLAAAGHQVTASDFDPAVVRFLTAITGHRGDAVTVRQADAVKLPMPDSSVDTVIGLHLLEHLSPDQGAAVVNEALRVARQRVVLAVPYEPTATRAYGHVRTFTATDLGDLGVRTGHPYNVHDLDGGWLILDHDA